MSFHDGPVPISGIANTPLSRKSGPIALKIEILNVTPFVKKVPKAKAKAASEAYRINIFSSAIPFLWRSSYSATLHPRIN